MKIIFADDMPDMRANILKSLKEIEPEFGPFEILGEARDGIELISLVEKNPDVDLILTDLRMPNMDGLTALVYLMAKHDCKNIFVISSENIVTMNKENKLAMNAEIDEKIGLLDKIAVRITNDEIIEGKINSILLGCEKLGLDPIEIAAYYGAKGYMRKPIMSRKLSSMLTQLPKSHSFIKIGII